MKLKSLHYLFSKKDKWGSKLIAWGSSKISNVRPSPAHVALLINEKWVFESTYKNNVSVMTYSTWKKENEEVFKLKCKSERKYEDIKKLFRDTEGKSYDWFGILYFSWRILLNLIFKLPIPKNNRLQKNDSYFCCEIVGKLMERDFSMYTPADVYEDVSNILK